MTRKMIAVVGPTASGKSAIAIAIARQYNGEVISADSRQVYRGMNLGSGKEPGRLTTSARRGPATKMAYMSGGVAHYMIDIVHPATPYNAGKFVRRARKIRDDILRRGKLPIVCGGTMFWVQAFIEDNLFPAVAPNAALREALADKSAQDLYTMLARRDPRRAATIDRHNRVRMMRALEIIAAIGAVPEIKHSSQQSACILAVTPPDDVLRRRIATRLRTRIDAGMMDEVRRLHARDGVSWKRLESFGLEYAWCTRLLRHRCDEQTFLTGLERDIWRYAKRQYTWLRRWERTTPSIARVQTRAEALRRARTYLHAHT